VCRCHRRRASTRQYCSWLPRRRRKRVYIDTAVNTASPDDRGHGSARSDVDRGRRARGRTARTFVCLRVEADARRPCAPISGASNEPTCWPWAMWDRRSPRRDGLTPSAPGHLNNCTDGHRRPADAGDRRARRRRNVRRVETRRNVCCWGSQAKFVTFSSDAVALTTTWLLRYSAGMVSPTARSSWRSRVARESGFAATRVGDVTTLTLYQPALAAGVHTLKVVVRLDCRLGPVIISTTSP